MQSLNLHSNIRWWLVDPPVYNTTNLYRQLCFYSGNSKYVMWQPLPGLAPIKEAFWVHFGPIWFDGSVRKKTFKQASQNPARKE